MPNTPHLLIVYPPFTHSLTFIYSYNTLEINKLQR